MKKAKIASTDNYNLSLHIFETKEPKAIIQMIHGMEEHQERYEKFAKLLKDNDYIVVTSDLRGHGKEEKNLGYFKDKNGHKQLIQDQIKIREYIEEHYRGIPVFLFGHSMGSIIARVLLQTKSNNYDKVILSGAPAYQSAASLGNLIARSMCFFKGTKYNSKLLQKITTGSFSKAIKDASTPLDWLSTDEKVVKDYIEDPLCGFNFTSSAYSDLFVLMKRMNKVNKYKDLNTSLPILFISGEEDPCTGGNKGLNNSIKVLKKAGFTDISRIDYKNKRHEILNEKDNTQVYTDILSFYSK